MTSQQIKSFAEVPTIGGTQYDFILLDASSSMADKWHEMLSAIDSYITTARSAGTSSQVILTTFSSPNRLTEQRNVPISEWIPLQQDYLHLDGGMTALYDGIHAIACSLRDLNPHRASILIVTDGDENASTYTDQNQARSFVDWMRAKGWQVTFMGCDFNNSHQAAALGATKRAAYGTSGAPMHFSDEEKQQFGGYLAAAASPASPKE